jgi:hypothetical protein
MDSHGFQKVPGYAFNYAIDQQYGIDRAQTKKLIKMFNESAAIGFLPPLRDSMHYVKRLHEEHGFIFHVITSLSSNENAQELRKMNLKKLFGETVFAKFIFLETGADKDHVLKNYQGTQYFWIEDKYVNAEAGLQFGLNPILMEHGHNMHYYNNKIKKCRTWREIYDWIISGPLL